MASTTTATIAVRVPIDLKERLSRLAEATGRTEAHYIREALLEHFEEIEDAAIAAERLREFLEGDEPSVPAEEVYRSLGI